MKVKEIIKILEDEEWMYMRTKGDHRIYFKKGNSCGARKISDDIPKGTEQSILRAIRK